MAAIAADLRMDTALQLVVAGAALSAMAGCFDFLDGGLGEVGASGTASP